MLENGERQYGSTSVKVDDLSIELTEAETKATNRNSLTTSGSGLGVNDIF